MTYRSIVSAAAILVISTAAPMVATAWAAVGDEPEIGNPDRRVVPFRGKVDQPDVMGGYASDRVIVRVAPEVLPGALIDGRPTFRLSRNAGAAGGLNINRIERDLAALLEEFGVSSIESTDPRGPDGFARPDLAKQFGLDRYYTISLPRRSSVKELVAELGRFPHHIEIAETDGIGGVMLSGQNFPNDPGIGVQYALHNIGQNILGQNGIPDADIDAPEAWALHTGTDEAIIAIIDTGVSIRHLDLIAKVIPGRNTQENNSNTDDSWLISHGTHCAGIATARTDNSRGIAGVSWDALIMPIKVLDLFGMGTEVQCANGVIWAADNGANVGSISLGYPDGISYFENAINYGHASGMLFVAASGNTPGALMPFPARWPNTMAVGATDNRDQLASFTTTGPEMSVTAPGVDVFSTWDTVFDPETYTYQSGTSMACPHASGLAALVWTSNLSLTNVQIRDIIEQTADDKGTPGWNPQFGWGRINAFNAVQAAMNVSRAADLTGHTITFGTHVSGGLDDLLESNDTYLVMNSVFGFSAQEPNIVEMIVDAQAAGTAASLLDLSIEARLDNPGGAATIALFNHAATQFEIVHTYSIGQVDEVEVVTDVSAANFINVADGAIRLRTRHSVIATFSASGFRSYFDWIEIMPR